ncbi:MAG: hypothetical protein ACOY46_09765 [Bacillota bacterium]
MGILFIIAALAIGIIFYGIIKTLRQGDTRSCSSSSSTHWQHNHNSCTEDRHDSSSSGCDSCDSCDSSSGCDSGGGQ